MRAVKTIIIVTLDCVRPDHLGCYGYRGVDTPHIDRLAREGLLFDQAICQCPNTWVSHASIFSGCNPPRHGVHTPFNRFSTQAPNLAELLGAAGFATAAFPAHTLIGPQMGFDRGFECFDLPPEEFLHTSMVGGNKLYRDWQQMWTKASTWISQQQRPRFVWLHYMGTHMLPERVVSIPADFRKRFSPLGQSYDAKVSWADQECVGGIRTFLKEHDLEDDSALVVLSDHGESLMKNGKALDYPRHNGELLEEVMRIALIMHSPGRLPAGQCIGQLVRSIDIAPTLLELAGVDVPETMEGRSFVGRTDGAQDDNEPSGYAYLENLPMGWLGIRSARWKLILRDDAVQHSKSAPQPAAHAGGLGTRIRRALGRPIANEATTATNLGVTGFANTDVRQATVHALYDLSADPDATRDVAPRHPDVVTQLKDRLARLFSGTDQQRAGAELSHEERGQIEQRLKALGYL